MKSKLLYFSSGAEGKRRCRRQALGRKFFCRRIICDRFSSRTIARGIFVYITVQCKANGLVPDDFVIYLCSLKVKTHSMDKHVTIYSTPTCHFCQMAKEFFAENNIQFTNHDVSVDADKRNEMISMTGQLGVPVIVVDGTVMVGFDREKVAEKLGVEA
jgi:glutaredoxin-like YruB-family protein